MRLSSSASLTRLDGFRSRAMRSEVPTTRHQYVTQWCTLDLTASEGGTAPMLMVSDEGMCGRDGVSGSVVHDALSAAMVASAWSVVVATVPAHRGHVGVESIFAVEMSLVLVQLQGARARGSGLWLLTIGEHGGRGAADAGSLGLGRSVRAETQLPLSCIEAVPSVLIDRRMALTEPEASLRATTSFVPRLKNTSGTLDVNVRLHLRSRGAIGNLMIEPLSLPPLAGAVTLRVRAVGLNFRDVLNVLGEYPGDPGPPGGDMAGIVSGVGKSLLYAVGDAVFGLGDAPLASLALAPAPELIASRPVALGFEQACTLPVTWSTTHTALERSALHAGHRIVLQAAAGGVGLKAVEYAHWLCACAMGTAGRPHKHWQLRSLALTCLCSSRDGAAFAVGEMQLLRAHRSHVVLNSLSEDFIAASFASLGEGGAFEEIGKRGIWSSPRRAASVPCTTYCAIALDADMENDPVWMHRALELLSARADTATLTSLPLMSFDMESQYERAFRTLQSGLNTGKIVVRISSRSAAGAAGGHVVSGGTGGLGLLTGRWLAERGALALVLASRSGALARDTATESAALQASGATIHLERCDTAEVAHARRLSAVVPSLSGVWHAAGVIADALLASQDAHGLTRVSAPKAHGAVSLHGLAATSVPLRACAFFSSVSALLGGAGQANYAAANACLDALAACRRVQGRVCTSVQWGSWAEVGMAARGAAGERMAAMEATSGFGRIGAAEGLAMLGWAVSCGAPAVVGMVPVTWSRVLTGV